MKRNDLFLHETTRNNDRLPPLRTRTTEGIYRLIIAHHNYSCNTKC